jgi:DNA-binding IclR family transcriptional regulator
MARASDGESVLHKHLRILDAFDALHPFRTQGDIADLTGLAPSTVHRLLSELEREGLVERLADRSYRLGIRLGEYASRTPGAVGLRELARPWLAAVQNRVRQHAQLGVLSGHDVVFVDRLSTRDAVVNATFIGGRTPLPLSSSGLVLLAHSTTAFVDDVVEAGWPSGTGAGPQNGGELRALLEHVRADGYVVADGFIHGLARGIAVPVLTPHGDVCAALSVVVPDQVGSVQAEIELLIKAAVGIRHSMQEGGLDDLNGPGQLSSMSAQSQQYVTGLDPAAGLG